RNPTEAPPIPRRKYVYTILRSLIRYFKPCSLHNAPGFAGNPGKNGLCCSSRSSVSSEPRVPLGAVGARVPVGQHIQGRIEPAGIENHFALLLDGLVGGEGHDGIGQCGGAVAARLQGGPVLSRRLVAHADAVGEVLHLLAVAAADRLGTD